MMQTLAKHGIWTLNHHPETWLCIWEVLAAADASVDAIAADDNLADDIRHQIEFECIPSDDDKEEISPEDDANKQEPNETKDKTSQQQKTHQPQRAGIIAD